MILLFITVFVVLELACSSGVTLVTPLQDQLPTIARVNEGFSWTISPQTFVAEDGSRLQYNASSLPQWLLFDPSTLTLSGTPHAQDEGNPEIAITAYDSSSSASSKFMLCVTSFPPPTLNIPIPAQLYDSNPSLSSVFLLAPNSAISTGNPALRIPPQWSFSIGIRWDTFVSNNSLYYGALQADGTALPSWIEFNTETITFNGYSPNESLATSTPAALSLALHASDQEGYTATSLAIDLIVAPHELSISTPCLPTINISASTPFNVSLSSPADFSGVLVDGGPIQPSDIAALFIDTSQYSGWLSYDAGSQSLGGQPPDDLQTSTQGPLLPVTLRTPFNQSIKTNVSLAIVPSYFSASELSPITASNDGGVDFNLAQYFSNNTSVGEQSGDVNLTASFEPKAVGDELSFNPDTAQLTGRVLANLTSDSGSPVNHISVTFTAYSHVTHSTSHANLPISLPASFFKKSSGRSSGRLSSSVRAKLTLGLGIAFGLIGGLALFGALLAAFRRFARVKDKALGAEESKSVWTETEKRWYGMDGDSLGEREGYRWTEKLGTPEGRAAMEINNPFDEPGLTLPLPVQSRPDYGPVGLGLHRILARTVSNSRSNAGASDEAGRSNGGYMTKAEFIGKIKERARNVSDTVRKVSDYASGRGRSKQPIIGKPVLVVTPKGILNRDVDGYSHEQMSPVSPSKCDQNPFDDINADNCGGSGIASFSDSSSSSTGERSIPRRRADFAPPRSPALVHFQDSKPAQRESLHGRNDSVDSTDSNTYAVEAVVQTASRAMSVRSGKSASGFSIVDSPVVEGARPRLVPFTSATRVPVPYESSPSLPKDLAKGPIPNAVGSKRVASQTARVFKTSAGHVATAKNGSVDGLSVGLHYVRSLGGDMHQTAAGSTSALFYTNPSTPSVASNLRSSFSSLESSRHGHGMAQGDQVMRTLVRVGEKFKFRVHVTCSVEQAALEARLLSGEGLPRFLRFDGRDPERKPGLTFEGVTSAGDVGEYLIRVYRQGGSDCVGKAIVEVVEGVECEN